MSNLSLDNSDNNLENLEFDSITMNTSLARIYLRENLKFHSGECCRQGKEEKLFADACNNKIYCIQNKGACDSSKQIIDLLKKMDILAEQLKINQDLFVQLDYMIRQTPVGDGKIYMDLIIKQFLYWSLNLKENDRVNNGIYVLDITDSAKLLNLGVTAFAFVHQSEIYLNASKQMAIICHLFATLCHKVGLTNIHLRLMESVPHENDFDDSSGCVGVITERSDLDSALDVFLASSSTSPWCLTQIYVQECVYKDFKATMTWKCKKNLEEVSQNGHHKYEYGTKFFILDNFSADNVANRHVVKVEAYRTTKELLSFLAELKADYMSLWSNDIAEANEIAHGVNCKVVWVNEFGSFTGPSEVSNSVFQKSLSLYHYDNCCPKTLTELTESWANSHCEGRKRILLNALRSYESDDGIEYNKFREFVESLKGVLMGHTNGFLDVSNDVICLGVRKPVGILHVPLISNRYHFLKSIASLALGNTMLLDPKDYPVYKGLIDSLVKSGVPIVVDDDERSGGSTVPFKPYYTAYFTDIKVIFMRHGTIFAN